MWMLAWDIINTIDNQYLGIKRKVSSVVKWLSKLPMKRCNTSLGILRRYMILSDFMLCPVFVGNHGLEIDVNKFSRILMWSDDTIYTERFADFIVKAYEYYTTKWILKVFDQGCEV